MLLTWEITVLSLCNTFQTVLVFGFEQTRRQEYDARKLKFEWEIRACQERQSRVVKPAAECGRRQREVKDAMRSAGRRAQRQLDCEGDSE